MDACDAQLDTPLGEFRCTLAVDHDGNHVHEGDDDEMRLEWALADRSE